jgi:transcription antitermination factor NusG
MMPRDLPEAPPWFVVCTLAGAARLVVRQLHRRLSEEPPNADWPVNGFKTDDLELYLPIREKRVMGRSGRGGPVNQRSPLFGPYLFARFDLGTVAWRTVLDQRGVRGFLKAGAGLAVVPDTEIEDIRAKQNHKGVIPAHSAATIFGVGDEVKVAAGGRFEGSSGPIERTFTRLVEHVDWRGDVTKEPVAFARVKTTVFGRPDTPIEIEERNLEPA